MLQSGDERRVVDLTVDLVRIPSVLGNEGAVAQRVLAEMQSLGFDHARIDAAGNAIGVIEGEIPGQTLLFDAHMDTVDVLPRGAWSSDPFGGEIRDGRVYGRGTTDMKGALAAMLVGVAALDRSRLAGQIVVSASVGEESTEGSALGEVLRAFPADYVVIGECSDLNLVRAGRGRAEFVIDVSGSPAHASTPHLGKNAVLLMGALIREVEALSMPVDPFLGSGVMCPTDIISSPYPAQSVVPSGCRVTYERRLISGETQEAVLAELHGCAKRAGVQDLEIRLAQAEYCSYTGFKWSLPKWYAAWETGEEHLLVKRSLKGLRKAGLEPRLSSYQFCTNAALSAAELGIPTVGFGPSRESLAHIVDEYVEVDQLIRAARGYAGIAGAVLSRSWVEKRQAKG